MPGTPFTQIILLVVLGLIIVGGVIFLRRRGILGRWPAAIVGAVLIMIVGYVLMVRPVLEIGDDARAPGLPADNVP